MPVRFSVENINLKNGNLMSKRIFTRSEAIAILNDLFDPDYMDEADKIDYNTWTNDQLEGELCSSGYIHDEDMGGVVN